MKIQEAAEKLQESLNQNFGLGVMTVGHDEKSKIWIYEHKKGFAKRRVRPNWLPAEFELTYKYVGAVKPC